MNLNFTKGDVFDELSDDDLLQEIKRRSLDLSDLDNKPLTSDRRETVRLWVDTDDVMQELDDDEIEDEAEERDLVIGKAQRVDEDEHAARIERLGLALHAADADQVFTLSRELYEQESGRILN